MNLNYCLCWNAQQVRRTSGAFRCGRAVATRDWLVVPHAPFFSPTSPLPQCILGARSAMTSSGQALLTNALYALKIVVLTIFPCLGVVSYVHAGHVLCNQCLRHILATPLSACPNRCNGNRPIGSWTILDISLKAGDMDRDVPSAIRK